MQRVVLDSGEIARSLKRISHEIIEANSGVSDLIVLGIPTRGIHLANRVAKLLGEIDPNFTSEAGVLDITLFRDDLVAADRRIQPTVIPGDDIDGKVVVIVDDVLFSGRSARAALDALIDFGRPKQVKLAVLVDRGHRELPIRPDFVGKNLPTAVTERVNVHLIEVDGSDEVVISS
jgi:pyrimidine operon attenuation protein/uracil phosphoribosyltransferase